MIDESEVEAATARGARRRATEVYARSARYDASAHAVIIDLSDGSSASLDPQQTPGLERASADALAAVEVSPSGFGIIFPSIDVDFELAPLISGL